jgi:hypothetical protein
VAFKTARIFFKGKYVRTVFRLKESDKNFRGWTAKEKV